MPEPAGDNLDRPSADSPTTALRRGRLLALLATAVALVAMALPVLPAPLRFALGHPSGEGASHLWGLVTTTRGLWEHGPFLRVSETANFPEGLRLDLVDPLHVLGTWPLDPLLGLPGAVAAWNLWHLGSLTLLAWGSWRLARVLGVGPGGAAVAVAGALGTPYLWAGLPIARSELLGCLLVPLLLSLLAELIDGRRRVLAAAAVLAAMALSGWQVLLLSALAVLPAVLYLLLRSDAPWRVLPRLLAVGALAALPAVPMLYEHLQTAPWWTERLVQSVDLGRRGAWTELPDLLRMAHWRPSFDTRIDPYPGLVLFLLALVGLGSRRARPWSLLGLLLLALSLGPRVSLGGGAEPFPFLAWPLAAWVPTYGGLTDWARLGLLTGPVLALAAGHLLQGRRTALLAVLCALLLADGLSYRVRGAGAFDTRPPDAVAAAFAQLPDGAVLELPGIAPDEKARLVAYDFSLLWSLSHGRAVAAAPSPSASDMLARSLLPNAHRASLGRGDPACEDSEESRLQDLGFASVLLYEERLQPVERDRLLSALERSLGPADGQGEGLRWWVLEEGDPGPERCGQLRHPGAPGAGAPGGGQRPRRRRGGPPPG